MTSPIILHLDRSTPWRGLHFERDNQPVTVADALREGFAVTPNDAPAALSLLENFIRVRDAAHGGEN